MVIAENAWSGQSPAFRSVGGACYCGAWNILGSDMIRSAGGGQPAGLKSVDRGDRGRRVWLPVKPRGPGTMLDLRSILEFPMHVSPLLIL